ncbi:DNA-processing protein DprA [Rhodoferax mekongensis]|uniref:DNA-processing protein DprA n=1 Tax=Rhodoferax mekongensis TaxID=3068341 RepID=A0ABZ0B4Q7_9BURK|nr:DNA-processing protein DprA [Rhodoferax sp. TBRC 17307]WNO06654.1 DNA-processing protein DprA [Rhodoferax sp. TBRC 17307]
MDAEELRSWLRLELTSGVGNVTARSLLQHFGLPNSIFEATESELRVCVTERQAEALLQVPQGLDELVDLTRHWLQAAPDQRRVLTLGDNDYPLALLDTEDPPLMLYAMGQVQDLASGFARCAHRGVAVVGSRNPTPQGIQNARQFSAALGQAGLTVVSGLALGIDGAAHEGALEGSFKDELATIAVVGTGLDRVYPKAQLDLAHRIAARGVLLSEYPLGTPPLSANFPKRNRIISGLCKGTLVVEAALKSGSLITARMAVEQGKEVFAIPGSIHSTQARGCHALIKQGAKLVESAQDILDELNLMTDARATSTTTHGTGEVSPSAATSLSSLENGLLDALGFEPTSLDVLQNRSGMDTATLQALLMGLELSGFVARLPGSKFQRLGTA